MSDLDKDIEILKEHIKELEEEKVLYGGFLSRKEAIENVLKELEELRVFSTETVRRNAELQEELETWKKIAEKLADTLTYEIWHRLGIKPDIKDLIENARKEVFKDEQFK